MALRKDYGNDEIAYHSFYDGVQYAKNINTVNDHMEIGYTLLNKVMPSYQLLIIFVSFINCWALSFLIYKYVPFKFSWLAVILIFLTPSSTIYFMMSGIRNGLSASILILSTFFIIQKKTYIVPYVVMGVIAASIHTSAIAMFAICYLLSLSKMITTRELIIWLTIMIFASIASLSSIVNSIMPAIELFTSKYVMKYEELAETADERGIVGALTGIVFAIGILLYLIGEKRTNLKMIYGGSAKYRWGLLYCFSFTLGVLSGRMTNYMIYFFIVVTVSIFAYWKHQVLKYGFLLLVLFYVRWSFLNWLSNPNTNYSIYKSIIGDF